MASASLETPTPDQPGATPGSAPPSRRGMLVIGAIVALAIVGATLFVGGREGFTQIGQGGANLSLLPKVGQPAPDITVALTDGKLVRLSDFRGQPVWLNFWGSWCPPCRAEMPDMEAAYEQLHPRGLVMLAVSLYEPMETAANYASLNHVTYLIASDPQALATGKAYPIQNFPTHILIDKDGIVRDVVLAELDKEEFLAHAQTILPARP